MHGVDVSLAAQGPASVPLPVLVVDDSAVNRMLMVRMLEVLGIPAQTAGDGHAAMEALGENAYAAVLMDVQMPRLDGVATTRWLRANEHNRRTPVIAVSGADSPADQQRCLEAGMDDFVSKPVDLVELHRVLARHMSVSPGPSHRQVVESGRLADLADQLGDIDLVREVVQTYLSELEGRRHSLDSAVRSLDRAGIKLISHSLKSSSALVGAAVLSTVCAELEQLAAEGDQSEMLKRLDTIEDVAPETAAALERWLELA